MMQYQRLIFVVFFLALGSMLTACSMQHLTRSDQHNIKGMPDWVIQGTHVVKSDARRVIHGVKMAALSEMSAQRPFNSYQSNPLPPIPLVVPWWSHVTPPAQMGGYTNELPPIGAATLGNITVQGPTADERARAEVARVLLAILNQLESSSLTPGGRGLAETRSLRQDIINEMLKEVRMVERWRDEQSNFIYSRVELDMTHAQQRMQHVAGLDPELRGHIETEMEQIFDTLTAATNRF